MGQCHTGPWWLTRHSLVILGVWSRDANKRLNYSPKRGHPSLGRAPAQGQPAERQPLVPAVEDRWPERIVLRSRPRRGASRGSARSSCGRWTRPCGQGARQHGFPADLWTLPRVAAVIERITGEKFHPGHVWKILGSLDWSVQKPVQQSQRTESGQGSILGGGALAGRIKRSSSAAASLDLFPR